MFHPRPIITAFLLGSGALATNTSAQEGCPVLQKAPRCGQQELGVNLFSWINVNFQDIHGLTPPGGVLRYGNGLLYKWHCHRNVLRAGVDVFRDHYTITEIFHTGYGHREGQSTDTRIRLGYERRFGDGRVQPFAGADVGLRYIRDRYDFESEGDFIYNPTSGVATVTTQQLFIAPFIGLDYRFADHWSVAMELTANFFTGHTTDQRDEHSYIDPDGSSSSSTWSAKGSTLDPVRSLCLAYHF
jgi:hypothetical protein